MTGEMLVRATATVSTIVLGPSAAHAAEPVSFADKTTAFATASADAEFAGLGKKVSEGFEAVDWKDVTALVRKPGDTSPEAIAFIGSVLRKQGLKAD